ncbi:MAG: hypothetical protein NTZ35_01500 [Ignavibacteriales bacterium]|nr:hypothetical protein [Ignavibacteriales bacterium]
MRNTKQSVQRSFKSRAHSPRFKIDKQLKKERSNQVRVYVKGLSEHGYFPKGAFAVIIDFRGNTIELSGSEENQSNIRMEMFAMIKAIEHLKAEYRTVVVFSELNMLVDAFQKDWIGNWAQLGWRKGNGSRLENRDLWKQIYESSYSMFVEFSRPESPRDVEFIRLATHYAKVALNLPLIKDQVRFLPISSKSGIHMVTFYPDLQDIPEEDFEFSGGESEDRK